MNTILYFTYKKTMNTLLQAGSKRVESKARLRERTADAHKIQDLERQVSGETDLERQVSGETDLERQVSGETDLERQVSGETDLERQVSGKTDLERQVSGETDPREAGQW